MIYLAIALIAAIAEVLSARFLFSYLTQRDERERAERRELYQRIQAPETAVAMAVAEGDPVFLAPVEADDDLAMAEARRQRLELAGLEMPVDVPEPPIEGDLIGIS